MTEYHPEQVRAIRNAIAEARARLRAERCYDPCRFAELFIRHDGIQTPGPPVARDDRRTVAEALLHALRGGARTHADPTVRRELRRARTEAQWAAAAEDEKIVGFALVLGRRAAQIPVCRALLNEHRGLGPGVFPVGEIVVLPPACDDSTFEPVSEDEVEQ